MSSSNSLTCLVRSASSDAILAIADALEVGSISLGSSSVGISKVRGVPDAVASEAYRCFALVKETLDEAAVIEVLRTAAEIRNVERLASPKVEVTWTGPEANGPLVTDSAVAIERCLKEGRDRGEILLVGYSLSVAKNSAMESVIELLVDASRRYCKIQVVLHKDDEEKNRAELMKQWDAFAAKPQLYTWDPPADHPYTKLHAKCLVVDRLQMIVTSANFTFHGLQSNIELGLLVRNQGLATAVHERFDLLINGGVLRQWKE